MKPLSVTVIIAAYNEEKYIDRCLASITNQSYKNYEVMVVDDGSEDKTVEIVKNYHVTLHELQHTGTAYARNYAAEKCNADVLVFLDADMEFENDFLEKLVEPIAQGGAMGTFSKLEYVKNWDKPLARCWNRINPDLPDKMRVSQHSNFGEDFRAILKTEFDRVGGFDNTGYTDTWTLSEKLGYKAVNAPQAIYYHFNPETLGEVYNSAAWIGKRSYKFGVLGTLITLLRAFFLLSLVKGAYRATRFGEPLFIPFQMVYDAGISIGAIQRLFFGTVSK